MFKGKCRLSQTKLAKGQCNKMSAAQMRAAWTEGFLMISTVTCKPDTNCKSNYFIILLIKMYLVQGNLETVFPAQPYFHV